MNTYISKNILNMSLFISLTFCMFGSCQKEAKECQPTELPNEYLIFGTSFYGTEENSSDLYLLTADHLFIEENINCNPGYKFNKTPMAQDHFKLSEKLWDMPTTLLTNTYNQDIIKNIIADSYFYVSGMKDGTKFRILYDCIDSTKSKEFYNYHIKLTQTLSEIER